MIFLRIRGETIKFASYLKKQTHMEEKSLIVDIENLESLSDKQNYTSILEDKKLEVENLRKNKIKGHITRSRIQWLKDGKKPTSFFCNLENKNFVKKAVRKLELNNGSQITNQKDILREMGNFYNSLLKKIGINIHKTIS